MTFSHDKFNFFVEELVEDNWGKLLGFSLVKNVDFIQSNLKCQIQFLVVIDYSLVKKNI